MVAISFYRGNLHKVPDLPRKWLMPKPQISLKDFRCLLRKRLKTSLSYNSPNFNSFSPNLNPNSEQLQQQDQEAKEEEEEVVGDNGCSKAEDDVVDDAPVEEPVGDGDKDQNGLDLDPIGQPPVVAMEIGTSQELAEEKPLDAANPAIEINNNVNLFNENERKKKDLEQKLQVLNQNKHNLVQMLKQILNAEEEMKRRMSMQTLVSRPAVPQVESTIDALGSNSRQTFARLGSEGNCSGELEGESEDFSSHNTQPHHFLQRHSPSPSASSPLRRPPHILLQQNSVPHPGRPSPGGSGHTPLTPNGIFIGGGVTVASPSPSRFAPLGHHHNNHLPPLSVSGTNFSASSPSPAASGGTSVFRENGRLTSPSWN
ncbi:hypothetical protein GIB67_005829 [Kingdonia uniflora]|uniref:Uncharacterized protein n=1 Tax=Kingdonia uniflora TaxID=39325 RepID=A0A7J7LU30_9MAGN|nr:hypothetical protein GIB67_005829 [Kingdonia uniflora]